MLYDHERLVSQKEQSLRAARAYELLHAADEQKRAEHRRRSGPHRSRSGVRAVLARALS